ncbi:hypothetical protein AKO1_001883 [Acrasis kona]|uniref:Pentatricopeptide repeat-containing protein n=1 Tax=Acrasis kona TaxID=1008807 RepID=A0AAW2Z8Q1_9EUKA
MFRLCISPKCSRFVTRGYAHTVKQAHSTIRDLAINKSNPREALEHLKETIKSHPQDKTRSDKTIRYIYNTLAIQRDDHGLDDIKQFMKDNDLKLSSIDEDNSYTISKYDELKSILKECETNNLKLTSGTLELIASGCIFYNNFSDVLRVAQIGLKNKIFPSRKMFHYVVCSLVEQNDIEKATLLVQDMRKTYIVEPLSDTIFVIVKALLQQGNTESADIWTSELTQRLETKPDNLSLLAYMRVLDYSKKYKDILDTYHQYVECADVTCFNQALKACSLLGDYSECISLLNKKVQLKRKVKIFDINIVLKHFILSGKSLHDAQMFLKEATSLYRVEPNLESFNILLGSLIGSGNMDNARTFYNNLCVNMDLPDPDKSTNTLVAVGYAKSQLSDKAQEFIYSVGLRNTDVLDVSEAMRDMYKALGDQKKFDKWSIIAYRLNNKPLLLINQLIEKFE